MIRISDLKPGDLVKIIDEGLEREGVVTDVDNGENQACIDNGVQEFWYPPEQIVPLPITDDRLTNLLGFEKEEGPDGVKYKKGAFRVVVYDPGNYTNMDIWYREDRRHFTNAIYLHELQNHHLDMTKMQLERVRSH